jgi:hypothetical protein
VAKKKIKVKEHTDGDEKEAEEYVAERQDVAERLVAVFRFGNDKPGQECPKG